MNKTVFCPECEREVRVSEPYAFRGMDRIRAALGCGHVVLRDAIGLGGDTAAFIRTAAAILADGNHGLTLTEQNRLRSAAADRGTAVLRADGADAGVRERVLEALRMLDATLRTDVAAAR